MWAVSARPGGMRLPFETGVCLIDIVCCCHHSLGLLYKQSTSSSRFPAEMAGASKEKVLLTGMLTSPPP